RVAVLFAVGRTRRRRSGRTAGVRRKMPCARSDGVPEAVIPPRGGTRSKAAAPQRPAHWKVYVPCSSFCNFFKLERSRALGFAPSLARSLLPVLAGEARERTRSRGGSGARGRAKRECPGGRARPQAARTDRRRRRRLPHERRGAREARRLR